MAVEARRADAAQLGAESVSKATSPSPWRPWHVLVLTGATGLIGPGTLIEHRLKLSGLPLRWQTRIETWSRRTASSTCRRAVRAGCGSAVTTSRC